MDRLPLEIIATIVSYLPTHTTAQTETAQTAQTAQLVRPLIASLSRKWQFAVERLVYREVRFKHTELDKFAAIFSQARRRGLLQTLRFDIVLPSYGDADCAVYESDQERLANNKVASEAITALFSVLATWGADPARAAILLYIHVYSPMDPQHRGADKLAQDTLDNLCRRRVDLFEQRYQHSYIHLSDPAKLPVAPCLRGVIPDAGARHFHPSSSLALITAVAAASVADQLSWQYAEPGVYVCLRRRMRDELVRTLQTFRLPRSVRRFTVDFESHSYQHGQRLPDLVLPCAHDPLCAALHRVVGDGLEALSYTGQVDPSFFWPYSYAAAEGGGGEPPEPFWCSLAELSVDFDMRSPSGRWYFRGAAGDAHNVPSSDEPLPAEGTVGGGYMPPGYGSDEEETAEAVEYELLLRPRGREGDGTLDLLDDFRVVPDEEVLVPLLEAFARAVAQMPALRTAYLTSRLRDPYLEWFVMYATPGNLTGYEEYMKEDDSTGTKPRVFLHVHGWTTPKQVLDTLRKIGQKRHGQDAIVTYMPSLYE